MRKGKKQEWELDSVTHLVTDRVNKPVAYFVSFHDPAVHIRRKRWSGNKTT